MEKAKMGKTAMNVEKGIRIGVYVCRCGLNISQTVDCPKTAQQAASMEDVLVAKDIAYACSEPGQKEIETDIIENDLNRIVIASCSPRLHEPTFRQLMKNAGLNPFLMEMANLREQCSWVHMQDTTAATSKAVDLVRMAIARVRLLTPLYEEVLPLIKRTLVIGGGIAGIQTALDLADNGYEVALVEKAPSIGGAMAQIDKTFPTMDCSI